MSRKTIPRETEKPTDDFVTLVEVAEDQQFGAETLLGVGDALLQFLVGGLAVFVRH